MNSISRFKLLLRNVAMNIVNTDDQNFALNLLLSIVLGETQISLSSSLSLQEAGINVYPKKYQEIQENILKGSKIAAIKILRAETGLGIKEAKDIVENPKYFRQA